MKKTTEESFLNDVKDHELTIISDEGNTRHIRLKPPKDSYYYYDITTWGDHLCISGDMGTYVFKRCEDMFRFFRMDKSDFNYDKEKTLQINSSYWHEKLVADSTFEPSMEFSTEIFESIIKEYFESYCEGNEVTQEWKDDSLKKMEDNLFFQESEEEARRAIDNRCWWVDSSDEDQESFAELLSYNLWEENLKDYTDHFIWCLYAIVWGIKKYDEAKGK